LRNAEFGFFGVVVYTRVQTPRFCGLLPRAGTLLFDGFVLRPFRTSWLHVAINQKILKTISLYANKRQPACGIIWEDPTSGLTVIGRAILAQPAILLAAPVLRSQDREL